MQHRDFSPVDTDERWLLLASLSPTLSATSSLATNDNATTTPASALAQADKEHAYDAVTTLLLNVTLIACLLAAYYVKRFQLYHLPESALSLMVGVVVGGIARLTTDNLQLFEFVSSLAIV
jgi:Na+/glutamate symporter